MSEFVLTGSDVFGRYCRIEQLSYCPNCGAKVVDE